jgi:hypothetical protein
MATTKKKRGRPKKSKKSPEQQVQEFLSSIEPRPEYVKHLVECRCMLPQFRNMDNPPNHKFVAFSELDEKANVKPSYAQCNNCGIIHKVTEVGTSITLKKEELRTLPTIKEIAPQLPQWLSNLLESHECELHTWQEAQFIISSGLWGRAVVLAQEREDDVVIGKICQILGRDLHKIENFERNEGWIEP